MFTKSAWISVIILLGINIQVLAHKDPNKPSKTTITDQVNFREDCVLSTAQIDQSINNVRARLLTGGDVWWDGQGEAGYVVPKQTPGSGVPEVSSIFTASIWLGGYDPSGNLKIAAGAYRNGTDFYPGPLNPDTGLTDLEQCNEWDRFFTIYGSEVEEAINLYDQCVNNPNCQLSIEDFADNIRYWPAVGNEEFANFYGFELPFNDQGLASFHDEDRDGLYNPLMGDFPTIDIKGCGTDAREDAAKLVPDEMIFWIFNDAGGPHTLSNGNAIKMEVQVQSFGYTTNDELNDMTFQRYKLINRADVDLRDTYFAMWVDPDLGCAEDDYIGCDVERSLMYVYNEDVLDGDNGCDCSSNPNTYCDKVPILGVDYFRGPLGPKRINIDQNGDTILTNPPIGGSFDTLIELGMSSFMYNNNASIGNPPPQTTDPDEDFEYYNILQGLWRDGTAVTFGGSGFNLGSTDSTRFVFPDAPNSDGWSMCTADLPFGDRRTIQASGPFLLTPGAVNELIIGVPWVPDIVYPCPDLSRLLKADDLAQAVFDNCFRIPRGPDAPDLCMVELDREIILVLSNEIKSNNYKEAYREVDILVSDTIDDNEYVFEGYKIYQLAQSNISSQEFGDVTKAKLIRQVDVKNGVQEIYNWTAEPNPNAVGEFIYTYEQKVQGVDEGISHTFQITEDAFAEGDRSLINHKEYHFSVVAYGYNEFEAFDPLTADGQALPYREGRMNIQTYTAVPRPIVYENLNSFYGDGPSIYRLDGVGNSGTFMEITDEMKEKILAGETIEKLQYKEGKGPIDVKIFNPLEVKDGTYEVEIIAEFLDVDTCVLAENATWILTHKESGETFESDGPIESINEQIFGDFGFSVSINQKDEPGTNTSDNNGLIGGKLVYKNPNEEIWFSAIRDEGRGLLGEESLGPFSPIFDFLKTNEGQLNHEDDLNQAYSNVADGYWYPFLLCDYTASQNPQFDFYISPAWKDGLLMDKVFDQNSLKNLNNVDIVFTEDRTKWSRCVVVETANDEYLKPYLQTVETTIGDVENFELRQSPSIDKNGVEDGSGTGMSWFPGYAIDVETGERLNIFFGENSIWREDKIDLLNNNIPLGADMMFNPSNQLFTSEFNISDPYIQQMVMGGGHNVFVTREKYDGCANLANAINGTIITRRDALRSITWTSMVLMPSNNMSLLDYAEGAIPNDLTVQLRVNNHFNVETEYIFDVIPSCETIGGNPKYEFIIENKAATALAEEEYEDALSEVKAVPNPYYGLSDYEANKFQQIIKLTNLPDRCDINIYSLDGRFIRAFNRDEQAVYKEISDSGTNTIQSEASLEWDLKNYAGIPIASGVYLIHISAPDLGVSRTIKWFGVNRDFDPSGL